MPHFNPRSPCGERPKPLIHNEGIGTFQSTLPVRGATQRRDIRLGGQRYFNPRSPCGERRLSSCLACSGWQNFNPRSPCGERLQSLDTLTGSSKFQSTLPVRGATVNTGNYVSDVAISIHAPRAGSDWPAIPGLRDMSVFQSTLPVRGATAKMPKTEPFILSNFHNFKKYTDRTRTKVIIKMELWINLSPFSGANRTGNLWSLLLRTLKGS